jgi:hypothetical protein
MLTTTRKTKNLGRELPLLDTRCNTCLGVVVFLRSRIWFETHSVSGTSLQFHSCLFMGAVDSFDLQDCRRIRFQERCLEEIHVLLGVALCVGISGLFIGWNTLIGMDEPSVPLKLRLIELILTNLPRCLATIGLAHARSSALHEVARARS